MLLFNKISFLQKHIGYDVWIPEGSYDEIENSRSPGIAIRAMARYLFGSSILKTSSPSGYTVIVGANGKKYRKKINKLESSKMILIRGNVYSFLVFISIVY